MYIHHTTNHHDGTAISVEAGDVAAAGGVVEAATAGGADTG